MAVVKRNYLEDIDKALNNKKKPAELLNVIFTFLNFKPIEIKIYNVLLKISFTIKQKQEPCFFSPKTRLPRLYYFNNKRHSLNLTIYVYIELYCIYMSI